MDKWELNRLGFKDKTSVREVLKGGSIERQSSRFKINSEQPPTQNDLQILEIDLRRKILINCIPHLIRFGIRIDKTKWTRLGSRMVISDLWKSYWREFLWFFFEWQI